jgi:hypothetical protein
MAAEAWTGLGAAIGAIRRELTNALAEGADSELKFSAGPIELELTTAIHTDAEGHVKVLLLPWSLDAKASGASERTQRIHLTLQPVNAVTREPVDIGARRQTRPG